MAIDATIIPESAHLQARNLSDLTSRWQATLTNNSKSFMLPFTDSRDAFSSNQMPSFAGVDNTQEFENDLEELAGAARGSGLGVRPAALTMQNDEQRPLGDRSSLRVVMQHENSPGQEELLAKSESAPVVAESDEQRQVQFQMSWKHTERDYESRPGKRRKLLPSRLGTPLSDHCGAKADPSGAVRAPLGGHDVEVEPQFRSVGKSPFASTEEMLGQVHSSEVAVLRRLAEFSVAVAHQVKELVEREDRVARVDELVANAVRVLEFAEKLGSSVSFEREFNAVLVEMEESVAITIDVLEECESGEQKIERVSTLLRVVKNLDEHYSGMSTVFSCVHRRAQALLGNEHGEEPVVFVKPTHQWTALSDLCVHITLRYSNPVLPCPVKQYSHMVQLVRVLKTVFSIIINDTAAVARFFAPDDSERIQSAVEFVVSSILSRPIPAEYLHMFKQLSLEMHGAGSRLRKLSVLLNEPETNLNSYLRSEEARLDGRRDLLSNASEPVTVKEHARVCAEYLRYIRVHADKCKEQATALTTLEARARTVKQLEELVDTISVTLYTIQAMNPEWDVFSHGSEKFKEIDNDVNETIKLVLDAVLPSTESNALEVLNSLSAAVGDMCSALPQLKVPFFRTHVRLLNVCCGWSALPLPKAPNTGLADSLGRSVAFARKCLEFAQNLEKLPSSQHFCAVAGRISAAFERWRIPEKVAENEDSLRLLTNAVEIAVKFACERRIPGLALGKCEKFDKCLSVGRGLFKDADEYLAEPHAKLQKFIASEKRSVQQTPKPVLPSAKKLEGIRARLAGTLRELEGMKKQSISLSYFDTVLQTLKETVAFSHPSWNPKSDPKVAQCADELDSLVHDISLNGVIRQRRDRLDSIKKSLLRPSRTQSTETRSARARTEIGELSERLRPSASRRVEDPSARETSRSASTLQLAGIKRTTARPENLGDEIEERECVDSQEAMAHPNQEETTSLFNQRDLEFQVRKTVATADEVFGLEDQERVQRFEELVKSIKTALEIIRELGPSRSIDADWLTQIEWSVDTAVLIGDAERERRPAMKSMVASTLLPGLSKLDREYPNIKTAIRQQLEELQVSGRLHIAKPTDSVFRTWQLLTNACAGVALQVENANDTGEKQSHVDDLLNLLESIFTRISESSAAQGKRMRPEHMRSVKKALAVAVKSIVEGGETLSLSEERRHIYAAFCEKVALARARDKVLEVSLDR